ncbi:MAG TPA: glycosyltransferase family A protein [Candidatus Methylomirabilis sp.]|nr:glycosyltransferase family A protein [Candidatus Methylomirabilis sp.]
MNDKPLVSIVIPVWNHALELARCLESLKRQTYPALEAIIVDDGSNDNPRAIVDATLMPFPVQSMRLETNRGAAAARNEGARLAQGSYLLFADADAAFVPNAVARLVETLTIHPEAAFAYSSFRFGWKRFSSRSFNAEALRRAPYIHTTALIRRDAFPGFDVSLKKFQDWDLWLTIVERGGVGVWIPEKLFTLSVGRKGMSAWLPAFFHRLPWKWIGWMPEELKTYRQWEKVVKEKHRME